MPPQVLGYQLTLFGPRGADYARYITTCPPIFLDDAASLFYIPQLCNLLIFWSLNCFSCPRLWSARTFKFCEDLWRGNIPKELEGLEDLRQAVSLVPCFDLFDERHVAEPVGEDSWTSTVYDYRF